jgi:hypothetical protein
LFTAVERAAREQGHAPMLDAWGDDLHFLRYRQIIFTASHGGFTAARTAYLDDDALDLFTAGIERMWKTLTGEAELLGDYGTEFTLRLTMLTAGHVKAHVEVNDTFAELRIEAETDQTHLPSLHDALQSLA